jgi:hypothetical protein
MNARQARFAEALLRLGFVCGVEEYATKGRRGSALVEAQAKLGTFFAQRDRTEEELLEVAQAFQRAFVRLQIRPRPGELANARRRAALVDAASIAGDDGRLTPEERERWEMAMREVDELGARIRAATA